MMGEDVDQLVPWSNVLEEALKFKFGTVHWKHVFCQVYMKLLIFVKNRSILSRDSDTIAYTVSLLRNLIIHDAKNIYNQNHAKLNFHLEKLSVRV